LQKQNTNPVEHRLNRRSVYPGRDGRVCGQAHSKRPLREADSRLPPIFSGSWKKWQNQIFNIFRILDKIRFPVFPGC